MKLFILCMLTINLCACIHTEIKPAKLCKGSPQVFSNELQCAE